MKVILSRKGFDSASGGCASPIFPNGRYYSLPIPLQEASTKRYGELRIGAGMERSDMGAVIEDLTRSRVQASELAHLDPDLDERALPRPAQWRPTFGQAGAQQTHLANQGVGVGDVFLFFGWFAGVERSAAGRWRPIPDTDIHAIFGWLQVGEVISVSEVGAAYARERWPWVRDHPHANVPPDAGWDPNTIYVAADRLRLPEVPSANLPGAGVFENIDRRRILTDAGRSRSCWRLPAWFKGGEQRSWLTNYPNPHWWEDAGEHVLLTPVGRQGQEAVLDCADRPEAGPWVAGLLR